MFSCRCSGLCVLYSSVALLPTNILCIFLFFSVLHLWFDEEVILRSVQKIHHKSARVLKCPERERGHLYCLSAFYFILDLHFVMKMWVVFAYAKVTSTMQRGSWWLSRWCFAAAKVFWVGFRAIALYNLALVMISVCFSKLAPTVPVDGHVQFT